MTRSSATGDPAARDVVAASIGTPERSALGRSRPAPVDAARLRWSRFLRATEAEGPGRRAALWVQGCSVHCPGCFNPQLWAAAGAQTADPEELAARWVAEALAAGSTGITLLGGEPFDQAAPLSVVARAFREAGLGVMSFSGYRYEQLLEWGSEREDIARLLAETDLLCDGPFLRDLPDSARPWIGSTNQSIRAFGVCYADDVRAIDRTGSGTDRLEVRIDADGLVSVNGWADDAALEALLHDIGRRADRPLPGRAAPASPGRSTREERAA